MPSSRPKRGSARKKEYKGPLISGWFPREVPPSLTDLLDDAAIQRIIRNAEGKKPIEWQLGTDNLKNDLIWCYAHYQSLVQHGSSKLAKSKQKHLLEIAEAANDFVRLFEGELNRWGRNQIAAALHAKIPESGLPIEKVLSGVRMVHEIANSAADPESNDYAIYHRKSVHSPVEEIVRGVLLQTFERHAGKEATRSRPATGGQADSPFIRFAVSALAELNIRPPNGGTYKPETVARALGEPAGSRRKTRRKKR